MKEACIYLVFSKTGTWLSRSIGVVTRSNYTHVSLSFDSNFDNMYSFGRLNPNNPFSGGLTTENLQEGVFKKSPTCQCLIYKVPITEKQLVLLKKELDYYITLNNEAKYKYNFLGLFAVLMDKPIKRKRHFFCSQFIALLLEKSSIWESPKSPELTRPTDLILISDKEVLYEGLVHNINYANSDLTPVAL
ncbi:hypothetical protein ACQPU1_14550 [Clostridium paraputrificum]|uniref:hypothetical protein n=1 Tax=Clostridium TaxID=1485 RepID=UPI003D3531FA